MPGPAGSERKLPLIEVGYPVFLADGAQSFGAVREVAPHGQPVLVVNVEGPATSPCRSLP